jgi:hypothetical protein
VAFTPISGARQKFRSFRGVLYTHVLQNTPFLKARRCIIHLGINASMPSLLQRHTRTSTSAYTTPFPHASRSPGLRASRPPYLYTRTSTRRYTRLYVFTPPDLHGRTSTRRHTRLHASAPPGLHVSMPLDLQTSMPPCLQTSIPP